MKTNKALELRKKHRLLQREVAELVGCSSFSVSRAERGGSPVVYEKILRVLGGDKIEPIKNKAPREKSTPEKATPEKLLSSPWVDTKTNWRNRYSKGATA